jgi:hypothetical protein
MKKLTLSAPDDVVTKARKLARARGTSISAMFANLIRALDAPPAKPPPHPRNGGSAPSSRKLARKQPLPQIPVGPLARQASGIIKLPPGKTDREVLEEALLEKYGLKA